MYTVKSVTCSILIYPIINTLNTFHKIKLYYLKAIVNITRQSS